MDRFLESKTGKINRIMHRAIPLIVLLIIGVGSQNIFEDIFDMGMGIPTVKSCSMNEDCVPPQVCIEGSVNTAGECADPNINSESLEEAKSDASASGFSVEVPQGCGYRQVHGIGSNKAPVREDEAQFGEFPWVVAILERRLAQNVFTEYYTCVGSLIHPKVVLTAAHHIWAGKSSDYKARAGEWDPHSRTEEFPHQDRQISYKIIHPRFNSRTLYYDIALLFLDLPFDLAPNINTICLPPPTQLDDSSPCYVSGWGIIPNSMESPNTLKKSDLTIRPNAQCERDLRATSKPSVRFTLHSSFMCAGGEEGKDACFGDGGAPLMCPLANSTNRYYQAGIVSWGLGCGVPNVPGVYANLRFLRPWVDEQLDLRKIQSSFYTAE